MTEYVILMLAAFLIAVLSGLGVGSAGLFVILLTLGDGMPQLAAQGLNLIFFLFSSGAALILHFLRTPPVFGVVLLLIAGGIGGSLVGSSVAALLPRAVLRRCFGGLLILSGALGIFGGKRG